MLEHEAFYRAILAEPAADVHRLVYADWLDESADAANAALAEFIRVQCELETRPLIDRQRYELEKRAAVIFQTHWQAWWRPICQKLELPEPAVEDRSLFGRVKRGVLGGKPLGWPYFVSDLGKVICRHYDPAVPWVVRPFVSAGFRRGFIEDLNLSGDTTGEGPSLSDWLAVVPVRSLHLTTRTSMDFSPDDTHALRHIRVLHLDVTDANQVGTYLWSPNFIGLEELQLHSQGEGVSAAEIAAIAASPIAPRLQRLELEIIDEAAISAFADATRFQQVRELGLTTRFPTDDEANRALNRRCFHRLADSPILNHLERFSFYNDGELWDETLRALWRRPWPRLQSLDLEQSLSPSVVTAMIEADAMPELRELSLTFEAQSGTECLTRLLAWPRLKQLTHFSCALEYESADPCVLLKLADALNPDVLQTLQLWHDKGTDVAAMLAPRLGERLWIRE